MKKDILLLTGAPGIGKTTIIRKVLREINTFAAGFFTREIRREGKRVGFDIVTLEGDSKLMAHIDFNKRHRVGKYGVDLTAIDDLATSSILIGIEKNALLILDEIGPMEILSENFRNAVISAIMSPCPILGTIAKHSLPFIDKVKSNENVRLIEVDRMNRNQIPVDLLEIFR